MTKEQREKILLEIANKVDFNTKQIAEMNLTIENHSKQIRENTEKLIRQTQNIAKLEFDLSNKIDILFDAISVYQDKDLEYKKSLIQLIKF